MKYLISSFFLFLLGNTILAQNGNIVAREKVDIFQNTELTNRISTTTNGVRHLNPKYTYLDSVELEQITYSSDGLPELSLIQNSRYLATPKYGDSHPCVIYNRGGNRNFGALNEYKAVFILAKVASWGYVGLSRTKGRIVSHENGDIPRVI